MWIHIFRQGTHTGTATRVNPATGQREQVPVTLTYSQDDLKRMEMLYNEQPPLFTHRAPVVLGHPENDAPARAWIRKLEARADGLWADLRNPDPQFVEDVNQGRYREKSAKFYSSGLLRHVAFLGAVPPAVKGLFPTEQIIPEFSEAPGENPGQCLEFAEPVTIPPRTETKAAKAAKPTNPSIPSILILTPQESKTMEELLKNILDAVTKLQTSIDTMMGDKKPADGAPTGPPQGAPQSSPPAFGAPSPMFPQYPQQAQYAEAVASAKLQEENAALRAKATALEMAIQEAEFAEFVNRPEVIARITPAMAEKTLEELKARARQEGEVEYSETQATGETVVRKGSAVDAFKNYIMGLPPQVGFSEIALKNKANPPEVGAQAEIALGLDIARSLNPTKTT